MRTAGTLLQPIVKTGERGPEGGLISSLSRPSVSTTGDVAIRLGFEPFSGGVAGIFLGRHGAPVSDSLLRIGEGGAARINGRVTSVNPKVSLNRDDRLAVLASIGGGDVAQRHPARGARHTGRRTALVPRGPDASRRPDPAIGSASRPCSSRASCHRLHWGPRGAGASATEGDRRDDRRQRGHRCGPAPSAPMTRTSGAAAASGARARRGVSPVVRVNFLKSGAMRVSASLAALRPVVHRRLVAGPALRRQAKRDPRATLLRPGRRRRGRGDGP